MVLLPISEHLATYQYLEQECLNLGERGVVTPPWELRIRFPTYQDIYNTIPNSSKMTAMEL